MVLPTGTITMGDVNNELGQASSTNIDLNSTAVRRLSGVTTANSTHSLDNLRGKGADLSSLGGYYSNFTNNAALTVVVTLNFFSDGTWQRGGTGSAGTPASGNWFALGSTANIGNYYWIRFTSTEIFVAGNGSYTASTGWLALSTTKQVSVVAGTGTAERHISYTIEIAADSGGSYIRTTKTNVELNAAVEL